MGLLPLGRGHLREGEALADGLGHEMPVCACGGLKVGLRPSPLHFFEPRQPGGGGHRHRLAGPRQAKPGHTRRGQEYNRDQGEDGCEATREGTGHGELSQTDGAGWDGGQPVGQSWPRRGSRSW